MRYAIVIDGTVSQITLWDGRGAWKPANGIAIPCPDDLHLGATYDGQAFTQPVQAPSVGQQAEKIGADNLTDSERATFKALAAKVAG